MKTILIFRKERKLFRDSLFYETWLSSVCWGRGIYIQQIVTTHAYY